jgi:CheY-like chemotaxis protein
MAAAFDTLRGLQVLIVDDEGDNAEFLRRVFDHFGAQVVIAEDGSKALVALQTQPFSLLLCDLSMPNLDGWQLHERIKHEPAFTQLPVIAITAHALRADQQRGLQGGFAAYVIKPIVDVPAFLTLVEGVLQRAG